MFSGLDTRSISTICTRLLASNGYFRSSGRTAIIATHDCTSISFQIILHHANMTTDGLLHFADEIVVLQEGRITRITTYEQLCLSSLQDSRYISSQRSSADYQAHTERSLRRNSSGSVNQCLAHEEPDPDGSRRNGNWSVYAFYLQSAGWKVALILAISIVLFGISDRVTSGLPGLAKPFTWYFTDIQVVVLLQKWSEANEQQPNQQIGLYLGVYGALFGISLLSLISACWFVFLSRSARGFIDRRIDRALFIRLIRNTGLVMHGHLLRSTLKYVQGRAKFHAGGADILF